MKLRIQFKNFIYFTIFTIFLIVISIDNGKCTVAIRRNQTLNDNNSNLETVNEDINTPEELEEDEEITDHEEDDDEEDDDDVANGEEDETVNQQGRTVNGNAQRGIPAVQKKTKSKDSKRHDKKKYSLVFAYVLSRHGARTPVNTYPKDPYVNSTFAPNGWGQLTNEGKSQMFYQGKWLKDTYRHLLKQDYNHELIQAQSTASPRTVMSIQLMLAGMFPPKSTPMEWNPKLNWQPTYVTTTPPETDNILRMKAPCARYDQALEEVQQSPAVQAELQQYSELLKNLTELTGMNVSTADDVNSVYITHEAEKGFGLTISEEMENYQKEMVHLASLKYIIDVNTTEMQRLKAGPFLEMMFQDMLKKSEGTLEPKALKMKLLCGHDWSMANVLMALGVWKQQMPCFASMVTFELYKAEPRGEYYFQIKYQNCPPEPPEILTVPGCTQKCPLKKLIELKKSVLPNKPYNEMCRPH